ARAYKNLPIVVQGDSRVVERPTAGHRDVIRRSNRTGELLRPVGIDGNVSSVSPSRCLTASTRSRTGSSSIGFSAQSPAGRSPSGWRARVYSWRNRGWRRRVVATAEQVGEEVSDRACGRLDAVPDLLADPFPCVWIYDDAPIRASSRMGRVDAGGGLLARFPDPAWSAPGRVDEIDWIATRIRIAHRVDHIRLQELPQPGVVCPDAHHIKTIAQTHLTREAEL